MIYAMQNTCLKASSSAHVAWSDRIECLLYMDGEFLGCITGILDQGRREVGGGPGPIFLGAPI